MNVSSDINKQIIAELKSAEIKSAEIDARILLEFVTGKSREFLLAHPEYILKNRETEDLKNLIERRKSHEPIAYITGQKEFFGLDFLVTPDVLIPRPETEILVEEGLKFLESRIKNREFRILDVGTGSGNVIISLEKKYRFESIASNQYFFASDISDEALVIARKNAEKHHAKVSFIKSDLFENIAGKYDLIVANLPYVPDDNSKIKIQKSKLMNREIDFEPKDAIFATDNGTEIIKRFLNNAKKHIDSGGLILAELDPRNAHVIKSYANKLYRSVELKRDFSGIYRLLLILT